MNTTFGPWNTAIHSRQNPSLNTFWKRRLAMLSRLCHSKPALSRREFLGLGAAGLTVSALPTFYAGSAVLGEQRKSPLSDIRSSVILTVRKDNGPYGTSAYSFRFATQDFAVHRNLVDLVYNGCGLLHVNAHGGMSSRIVDLGKPEFDAVETPPKRGWRLDCIQPLQGHVYVQEINVVGGGGAGGRGGNAGGRGGAGGQGVTRAQGAQRALVKFVITEMSEGRLKLKWATLNPQGRLPRFRKSGGTAGTMGQCGGPHRHR